jgi:hypothetical protein
MDTTMSILISSDQFPEGERFESWRETLRQSRMASVEVQSDNEGDFRFRLRFRDLGALRVVLATAAPYGVRRTPRLIRQSDPDLLSLGMSSQPHPGLPRRSSAS